MLMLQIVNKYTLRNWKYLAVYDVSTVMSHSKFLSNSRLLLCISKQWYRFMKTIELSKNVYVFKIK